MANPAQAIGLGLFRGTVTLHTALLIVQPVLAGRFLSGEFGMLAAHSSLGGVVLFAGMLQFVGSVALWWPGRRGGWPIAVAAATIVLEVVQLTAGYSRALGLHLPLGVALVAAGIGFAVWAWLPHPVHRRVARPEKSLAGVR